MQNGALDVVGEFVDVYEGEKERVDNASSGAMHPTTRWWHGRTTLFKRLLKINSGPTFISRQESDSIILMPSSPPTRRATSACSLRGFCSPQIRLLWKSHGAGGAYNNDRIEIRMLIRWYWGIGFIFDSVLIWYSFNRALTARHRETVPRMI